jgi:hypothetical protein
MDSDINTSQDIQNIHQDTHDILEDTNDIPQDQDISENKKKRSIIHNHFTLDEVNNRYKCNHYNKSYQIAKDGSTSSFRKHLKVQHNDKFLAMDQLTDAFNNLEISETLVYILFYSFIFTFHLYNKNY